MHQLKMRVGTADDARQIVEWLNGNVGNLYDPDILTYPTLRVLCSYDRRDVDPVAYLPTQQALMLESLAINPKAKDLTLAQAARDLVKGAQLLASTSGIREIYCLSTDPQILKIAENHGFERVPYPVVRLKL